VPATISNPRDLFLTALADILFVERLLSFEVLPTLLKQVGDPQLAGALAEHLQETKQHVTNVEQAFLSVGAEPSSNHSPPFVGLEDQHATLAGAIKLEVCADAFHAHAAAHTEHYEIASYRTLVDLARALGKDEAATLLEANLADEQRALAGLEDAIARLCAAMA
jgi:ferritin-like metal-binding protein YciE